MSTELTEDRQESASLVKSGEHQNLLNAKERSAEDVSKTVFPLSSPEALEKALRQKTQIPHISVIFGDSAQNQLPIRIVLLEVHGKPLESEFLFTALQSLTSLNPSLNRKFQFHIDKEKEGRKFCIDVLDADAIHVIASFQPLLVEYQNILSQFPTARIRFTFVSKAIHLDIVLPDNDHQDNTGLYDLLGGRGAISANKVVFTKIFASDLCVDEIRYEIQTYLKQASSALQNVCPPLVVTQQSSGVLINIAMWEAELRKRLGDPYLRLVRVPGKNGGSIKLLITEPSALEIFNPVLSLGIGSTGIEAIDAHQINVPFSQLDYFKQTLDAHLPEFQAKEFKRGTYL